MSFEKKRNILGETLLNPSADKCRLSLCQSSLVPSTIHGSVVLSTVSGSVNCLGAGATWVPMSEEGTPGSGTRAASADETIDGRQNHIDGRQNH